MALDRLGNYRLIRSLGSGTFGEIYLGEHLYLRTRAAIKVLRMQMGGNQLPGFLKEAQLIANLKHRHIVPVLEFGVQDNLVPFLAMEYAPNGTLRTLCRRGPPLQLVGVVPYITQAAGALQHAHEHRIIHHDVKPENMLLNQDKEVLLSDFGLAKLVTLDTARSMAISGSPAYIAPEQWRGQTDFASDQYALAVIAYELLTGYLPFEGPSLEELTLQHLEVQPPPPRKLNAEISRSLEEVILQALAKKPEERFASVSAFADAFKRASEPSTMGKNLADSAVVGLAVVGGLTLAVEGFQLTNRWLKGRKEKKLAEKSSVKQILLPKPNPMVLPSALFSSTLDDLGSAFIRNCLGEAQTSMDKDQHWQGMVKDWFEWAAIGYVHDVQTAAQAGAAQSKPDVKIPNFRPGEATTNVGVGTASTEDDRPADVASWITSLFTLPVEDGKTSLGTALDGRIEKIITGKNARQEMLKLIHQTAEKLLPSLNTEAIQYLLRVDRFLSTS